MIWFILLGPVLFLVGIFMRDGNMDPTTTKIGEWLFNISLGLFILDLIIILVGAF
jgi:hypothetical protein